MDPNQPRIDRQTYAQKHGFVQIDQKLFDTNPFLAYVMSCTEESDKHGPAVVKVGTNGKVVYGLGKTSLFVVESVDETFSCGMLRGQAKKITIRYIPSTAKTTLEFRPREQKWSLEGGGSIALAMADFSFFD